MATKKEDTASFVIRFNQKIFESEEGESQVQWRGHIRHVQGGDESRFSEFEEAMQFIQGKLAALTIQAVEDKSPEEQKGILAKSFELWRQVATDYPKKVTEIIKDPLGSVERVQDQVQEQVTQIQEQVQEQVTQMSDRIRPNLDPDAWKPATKADLKRAFTSIDQLTKALENLAKKVDQLNKS